VLISTWVHRSVAPEATARSPRALLAAKSLLFVAAAIVGGLTRGVAGALGVARAGFSVLAVPSVVILLARSQVGDRSA
jgi:hypothetical protein